MLVSDLFICLPPDFDESKMKTGTKWAIGLGVGIPGVLVLIGIICLIVKFFMKRCRKKPWENITTPPKPADQVVEEKVPRRILRRKSSERQPLYPDRMNTTLEASDSHISIPIEENIPPQTVVQVQRDRLNQLKDKDTEIRSQMQSAHGENDIQRAIDPVQREFEESV